MYKIYKIVDNTNNNVYIGQTKNRLERRISQHKCIKWECSHSKFIIKNNDWYYELIEETDDIEREKYWIRNTKNCINPTTYDFDAKENKKKWVLNNKEKKRKYMKEYCKNCRLYKNSWGGDPRTNNNLLLIDAETVFY
jgi:predicted GIY-YIG superfamily endonuclease